MSKSHLGLGVMINMLSGNEDSVRAYQNSLNKEIIDIKLEDDKLKLFFKDNTALVFSDEGQSCCEYRYMVCADRLQDFIGSTFLGAELKDAPDIENSDYSHEVQFLDINTSKGTFQCANHNEHNGYYGGFSICCRQITTN